MAPTKTLPSKLPVGTKLTLVPTDYMARTEAVVEEKGIRVTNKDYIIGLMTPDLFFRVYAFGYFEAESWMPRWMQRQMENNYVRIKLPGDRKRYIVEKGDPVPELMA